MTPLEMVACFFLILTSAYLSASEIALFSLSRFQLRLLKENLRPIHRKIKQLLSDSSGLLITILIANELLNICLSTLITDIISRKEIPAPEILAHWPAWMFNTFLGLVVTTPVILIFCEITPKVIAVKINQIIAVLTINPLTIVYHLFKPIRYPLKAIANFVSGWINRHWRSDSVSSPAAHEEPKESILNETDFLLMLEEGRKEGAIQESELELIKNVFELDNTSVEEVCTPLAQVLSLPATTTVNGALAAMRSRKYSRIPVTGKSKKDVIGILYSRDLLRAKLQAGSAISPGAGNPIEITGSGLISGATVVTIGEIMRKPFFVSSSIKLNRLFRKLKQQKTHIAIVKNADGEVTGLVTMSDILDVLFDEFFTEVYTPETP